MKAELDISDIAAELSCISQQLKMITNFLEDPEKISIHDSVYGAALHLDRVIDELEA